MKTQQPAMSPQDVVILLKIISYGNQDWNQEHLSKSLCMSQSEISKSMARSKFSGLLDSTGKKVRRLTFMEFLQYGIAIVFPQKIGPVLRGMPTAHSASPIYEKIQSNEIYVWPYPKGKVKGHSIGPLYPSVPDAIQNDKNLYELLALVDAVRIGKAREREIAISELKMRILNGE